jgi:hypothetical protein
MDLDVDITCPECGKVFKQKLRAMSPGKSAKCPGCGVTLTFAGDGASKVQKELDKLERSIKDLSKSLKIKF